MNANTLRETFAKLVDLCATTEEGRQVLTMFNHRVQFTPLDGEPFYLEAQGEDITLNDGVMPETPITAAHEIKGETKFFILWFSGKERLSDLIERGQMFPVASHTTKRHIDHWLARIVRMGNEQKAPREVY